MKKKKSSWRRWNNIIHRDLGYLCFGLTIVYAVSGVAVNHIGDWNPNYSIEEVTSHINPITTNAPVTEKTAKHILSTLGETGEYKSMHQPDLSHLQIFVEGNSITVNLPTGEVTQEKVTSRPILREMNFLHLNHAKKLWTFLADLYAVALTLLAITGLFVIKGKKGITGRGAWLTTAGVILPIVFLWLYL